jgi:hypothetical protein
MEHFVKLLGKNLSDSDKEEFVKLVKSMDPSVTEYHDDNGSVVVETDHSFSHEEIDQLFKKCEEKFENFFLMASNEEDLEESKKEKIKEESLSKDDIKKLFDSMCEELEVKLHNRVIEKKSALGWRHGEKFDPHEKTSPLMMAYHDLPESYKIKNGKILNDVIDILKKNGFTVSIPKKHHS